MKYSVRRTYGLKYEWEDCHWCEIKNNFWERKELKNGWGKKGKNKEFFNKGKELSRYFIKAEGEIGTYFSYWDVKKKIGNLFILRVNP